MDGLGSVLVDRGQSEGGIQDAIQFERGGVMKASTRHYKPPGLINKLDEVGYLGVSLIDSCLACDISFEGA